MTSFLLCVAGIILPLSPKLIQVHNADMPDSIPPKPIVLDPSAPRDMEPEIETPHPFQVYVVTPIRSFRAFLLCLALAAGLAYLPPWPNLEIAAQRSLFILFFAAALWITEALPAFAVAVLIMALQIALLGHPGGAFAKDADDWGRFVQPWASPVMWLFFAGFVLASAAVKTGLDRRMALAVLSRIPPRPGIILFAVMAITFTFSMFMSNTATAAMMLAVISPLVLNMDKDDRFAGGLTLSVAFGASIGGMGTIIGTPPNAIAAGALAKVQAVTFAEWIGAALPVAIAMAAIMWTYLYFRYPSKQKFVNFELLRKSAEEEVDVPSWQILFVPIVFTITVLLWLTTSIHGIPSTVVSFVPITALVVAKVTDANDIRRLPWDVLLLLAGGISLGVGVSETGLAKWLVAMIPVDNLPLMALASVLALVTLWMSNFMSNTAAANILIPLGMAIAGPGNAPPVVIAIALGASSAFLLPSSTPPNAIAYSVGRIKIRDFVEIGVFMGVVAPIIISVWLLFYY